MTNLSEKIRTKLDQDGVCHIPEEISNLDEFEKLTTGWLSKFHVPAIRMQFRVCDGDKSTTQILKKNRLLAHAEGYYRPCIRPPDVGFFWCSNAPQASGGETVIVDGKKFYESLSRELKIKFETEKIIYESIWTEDRWCNEFNVNSIKELTNLLNCETSCKYAIHDKQLHLFYKTSPFVMNKYGQYLFINGLLAHLPKINHPKYDSGIFTNKPENRVLWGGSFKPLSDHEINELIDIHDNILEKHRWNVGDLLIVDNHRVLHGREPLVADEVRVIYSRFGYW